MVTDQHLLSGVRVLDLTKATSGPFCTQILGDLGADVIKVEEPPTSRHRRDVLDAEHRIDDMDAFFVCANRNKRSITLELADPNGLGLLHRLVAEVDVVIDNYRPGVTAKLGVDHDTLKRHNPRIITCSLSAFGSNGPLSPRAGFDITIQAETGMTDYVGLRDADGVVRATPIPIADLVSGMYCAVAIPAALHRRSETGEGAHIDVAMYDSVLSWFVGLGVYELNFGERYPVGTTLLWGTFETKDRPIVITAHRASQYERFCHALDRPGWLTDPRFAEPAARARNMGELRPMIDEILLEHTADEWAERFDEAGLSYARVRTLDEAFHHPQAAARNMAVELTGRDGQPMSLIGSPIKVDGVAERFVRPPAPGEHTAEVLAELLHDGSVR